MKKLLSIFALGIALLLTGCCCKVKTDLSSPENTFKSLVAAIQNKDIDAYAACWYSERAEKEGLVGQIKLNPSIWDELQTMVVGKLDLVADGEAEEKHGKVAKFNVNAPDVPQNRKLSSISLIKEGNDWKMYHW